MDHHTILHVLRDSLRKKFGVIRYARITLQHLLGVISSRMAPSGKRGLGTGKDRSSIIRMSKASKLGLVNPNNWQMQHGDVHNLVHRSDAAVIQFNQRDLCCESVTNQNCDQCAHAQPRGVAQSSCCRESWRSRHSRVRVKASGLWPRCCPASPRWTCPRAKSPARLRTPRHWSVRALRCGASRRPASKQPARAFDFCAVFCHL